MQLGSELAPLIIENAPVIVLVLDSKARILDFNPRMTEITGHEIKNLRGKNWFDAFLEKEERSHGRELFSHSMRGVEVRGDVSAIRTKHGQKRLIAWNEKLLRSSRGDIIGLLRIGQDVTEREQIQEALRESEEKYRFLAESANDFIFIFNERGDIQYINTHAVSRLECPSADMTGRNLRDIFPESVASVFLSHIREAMKTAHPLTLEFEARLPGGTVWLHTYLVPLRHKGDITYAVLAVARDLTDRKKSEQSLEEAKQRFEAAIGNTPLVAIQGFDREGTIQHWNPVCERIYGFDASEALGRRIQELVLNGDLIKEFEQELKTIWESGKPTAPRQWSVKTKPGKDRWMYSSMFPVFHEGAVSEVFCMDVDITDQKRAEDLLRKSEEKYRLVADFTYDWESWLGPDGNFLYVSPSCERITGYSVEKFMADPHFILNIISPEHREMFAKHFEKNTHDCGEICHMDFKIIRPNGEERWISHSCQPVYHIDGSSFGRRASNRDITERKRAEEETAFLKGQIEFVLGATQIGMDIIDPEFNLRYIDPEWQKVYGGEPGGKKCYEYFMHADKPCDDCGVLKALETKTTITMERKLPLEGDRWVQVTTKPFQNEKGEWLVAETNVDITARKWAEQVLRESEDKYATLIERARDGVVIIQDGIYQFANKAFYEMLGYSAQEVAGMPIDQPIIPEHKAMVKERYTTRVTGGNPPPRYDLGILKKDGSVCYGEVSAALIQYKGKPAVMAVFRDVTERRQLERDLRQAKEQAEEASRTKSRFIAHVSHEIRTPLNAILGFSELLNSARLNSAEQGYLNIIRESGEVLLTVISDILDVSKVEAGELSLEDIDFNLADLVESVIEMVRPRLSSKDVALSWRFDKQVPLYVKGDPTRMRQVLLNLLNNAAKFTERGEIKLAVALANPPRASERKIKITVHDTGVGIPPDKREAIFDAFVQSDTSITRKYGGTGLGLHIVKRLVELMGGEIRVESKLGKGSEFTATVVLHEGRVPTAASKPEEARALFSGSKSPKPDAPPLFGHDALRGARILVAEDNHVNLKLIGIVLKNMGCVVDVALDGAEAVAKAKEGGYDAVFLDLEMPLMGGLEVARTIRNDIGSGLPLVALTAHAMKEDEQACYDAGMNDYLAKPVSSEKIKEKILRWVKPRAR